MTACNQKVPSPPATATPASALSAAQPTLPDGESPPTATPEPSPSPRDLTVDGQLEFRSEILLGTKERRARTKNYVLGLILHPVYGGNSHTVYDFEKKQGLLVFDVDFFFMKDVQKNRGAPTLYTSRSRYLFTEFNQDNLDDYFDTHEAAIYLQDGERIIQVGKYRPSPHKNSLSTWERPNLCEDEFKAVCHLEVRLTGNPGPVSEYSYPFLADIYLVLSDSGTDVPLVSTPTKPWDYLDPFLNNN